MPFAAYGQGSAEEIRRERVETIEELRRTEDISGRSSWISRRARTAFLWRASFGGVYSPSFTTGDNNDRDASAPDSIDHTWDHDLRWFAHLTSHSRRTRVYARLKTTFAQNSRTSTSIRRTDFVQPTVDLFYVQHRIPAGAWRHGLTVGRQFVMLERGLTFGLAADGIMYELRSSRNESQIFFLRQMPGDDNLDLLAPGAGRAKRLFYGGEWKRRFFTAQKIGLSLLINQDRNSESPDDAGQRHRLDSLYYGLGLDGRVLGNLSYWALYISERGKTYPAGGAATVDISARAIDAGLRYFFRTAAAPSFYAEYAAGSGDGDATGPGTGSSAGGSAAGEDKRFHSFGGLQLGYAFAPQLTNLRAVKLGMSLKPFTWIGSRLWSEISVQPTYYVYRKEKSAGAISDPSPHLKTGAGASRKLGSEFDLTIAWKAAVDFSYQFKFGRFNPGDAYANRASETYLKLKAILDL